MEKFSLLIMCAGFGSRMLDLTNKKPKPLLEIKNVTLLENSINFFLSIGCNKIFINTHYLYKDIENFIKKKFKDYPISLVYEPVILGTGGGIKNIFNFIKKENLLVSNSDILWQSKNKKDIINFARDINNVKNCKLLLSEERNFLGLKSSNGDFRIINNKVSRWTKGDEIIFYSGLQIVSPNIFKNTTNIFPINTIWDNLIKQNNLLGELIDSKITHLGDKKSFEEN